MNTNYLSKYKQSFLDNLAENTILLDYGFDISKIPVNDYEACLIFPHEEIIDAFNQMGVVVYTDIRFVKGRALLADRKSIEELLDDTKSIMNKLGKVKHVVWKR